MIPSRSCRSIAVFALMLLASCRHGARADDMPLMAPPLGPGTGAAAPFAVALGESTGGQSNSGPVVFRAELSHTFYKRRLPDHLTLRIDLVGIATATPSRRPSNLALVFDRSGSMAEDQKFMHAMEAVRVVVENLSERDLISLVVFNDQAAVLSPAGRAVNKEFLRHRLAEFGPAGYTNLSAGLLEGLAQIDSQSAEHQLKRLIVLTDGIANRGITNAEKLRKLAATARERGIGISTIGVGTKFDEKLMTMLAEAGGGRYTYVASAEQIPNAVAAELSGLLDTVAQNAKLEVQASQARITRVYGRVIESPVESWTFSLGDIRDGDRSVLLLELAPQKFEAGAFAAAQVILTIDDPESGGRRQLNASTEARHSEDAGAIRAQENEAVILYAGVRDALEKAEESLAGLDTARFKEASGRFDQIYEAGRRKATEMRDQELLNQTFLLKHFMADLTAASEERLLHGHDEAKRRFQKETDYRRYLLEHHRP